jgi:hypothetical protein
VKDLTEYLATAEHRGCNGLPHYYPVGDYLTYFAKDERCFGEQVDPRLVIYRAADGGEIIGVKVCDIKQSQGSPNVLDPCGVPNYTLDQMRELDRPAPVRTPFVAEKLEALDKEAVVLSESINALASKLKPVLHPGCNSGDCDEKKCDAISPMCDVAMRVTSTTSRLRDLSRMVRELNDRCQL